MGAVERDAEFSAYASASRPAVWRTAYLLCGSAAQADDLVQNVLLKLYLVADVITGAVLRELVLDPTRDCQRTRPAQPTRQ